MAKKTTKTKSLKNDVVYFTVSYALESDDSRKTVDIIINVEGDMDTDKVMWDAINALTTSANSAMLYGGKVIDFTVCD